jgi:hypothetical protein
MLRFTDELIARVKLAGATGINLLRADSGFWNVKVFGRLETAGWEYSIGVRMQKGIRAAVEAIEESAWQTIEYPRRRWRISPRASSTPTALGPCSARSRTTCSDGHN